MARRFHRVRHHAGRAMAGGKGSLISVGTGAGVGALSSYAMSAAPFLQTNWWAMPAALALVGHFLKRKNPAIGGALLGVAGYWGFSGYMQNGSTATTKGFQDAGMVDSGRLNYDQGVPTSSMPLLDSSPVTSGFDDAGVLEEAYGLQD